ncbi:hypothetical protein AOC36_01250 [Erysipelothrix larvae]|uniref:HTH cro/C1-type domain-containing protein n=1 Tax=Erysipelothrix larvae TaxID=1514105 RepID=A0A0X8GYA9_9FIRM|nr:hypothetical protein AOC36_01250 [Erysipelothrix larvae]
MITNRIKEIREIKGYTQIDLASMVQVSRQTIISLEKGSYNPTLELAFKISIALDANINDIFMMEDEK